jgi:HEAT repeat protein
MEYKMKTLLQYLFKAFLPAAVFLLVSGFTSANAQTVFERTKTVKEHALPNLAVGIKSDNEGLKKSSIFFAGHYKIPEMVKPLSEQLRRENDASVRVLIALSLFEIGTAESMEVVKNLAANDRNTRVRNMSRSILEEYGRNTLTSTK